MQIYLNGELTDTPSQNLLQLIQELALEGKRFAVEHNQQIVPKSKLEQITIAPVSYTHLTLPTTN
ncbi:sulfur carrier protein ThiS, partial [Acinetobacter baumannii]